MSGGGAEFQFATELPTATFAIVVWILPVPGLPQSPPEAKGLTP